MRTNFTQKLGGEISSERLLVGFLDAAIVSSEQRPLRVVIVGHVDHGKSTLVGRLLYETGSLPEGKFEQIQTVCCRRSMQFEWAFLMDALQAERDQNITIDVSQIWFETRRRNYVIIDAPGHKEFLRNMVSGAASADAALLLIDAHEGIQEQSRQHAYLLSLLGIQQVVVVINKMDLISFDQAAFRRIESDCREFLRHLNIQPLQILPIAARDGVNMVNQDPRMSWYDGPTLIQTLDDLEQPAPPADLPLRFAIQDVYRFDHRRILAGRIESGTLRVGDRIIFAPSNKGSVVASIEVWNAPERSAASAGESVGITLQEQIFVERGCVGIHIDQMPIETNRFRSRVFWMGDRPLSLGKKYKIKLLTQEVECQLASIDRVTDASTLETSTAVRRAIEKNEVAEVTIQSRGPLVIDNYDRLQSCGRFVLVDGNDVAGGGIVFGGLYLVHKEAKSSNITWSEGQISYQDRIERNGHPGLVVWLTGLPGSGKSTLARALEQELFVRQMRTYVLDGDNIRHGLNANLSFSPEDRAENIRRIAEIAKLLADTGIVTIASFISPYRLDRLRAREIVASGGTEFLEVYVSTPLEICERRDPKNLYRKARAGEIKGLTGLDAPYEAPENPEIVVETGQESPETCIERLLAFLLPHLRID